MLTAVLGALAIGVALGLLGSGGSILTVPVLVYGLGQPEKVAIAGSLAIVGTIALAGAIPHARRGQLDRRSVGWFGLPGVAGTVVGASLSEWLSGPLQLSLFGVVMLAAAVMMFRDAAADAPAPVAPRRRALVAQGAAVGLLTGVVGVGGGFLILPALVLLGGLPMHRAVGTSLAIIAINAWTGFARHLPIITAAGLALDWPVLALLAAVGSVASVAGQRLGSRVPQRQLRRAFALFLVLMAALILWRELPLVLGR